jgi:glyoxylase-like metal-dependent hydrolase (beta-lactamase superfamily II)
MIPDMIIRPAAAPPFFKNGYLVACDRTREAVLIDPGDEVQTLLGAAERERLDVKMILLTHAHLDHITGVATAKRRLGVGVWLHRDDEFLYNGVVEQGRLFGLTVERQPPIDNYYEEGQQLACGDLVIDVLHTPGHCPGGVCLAIGGRHAEARNLFVGDTLFAGSIGRTDLPGGDTDTLLRSIRTVLFSFPDETAVYSGHGPVTTIGEEKRSNPFLSGR